jgi:hypothetical protein
MLVRNKIFLLVLFLISSIFPKAQSPVNLPLPNSPTAYYNVGWLRGDSGIISALRDTTLRPLYPGTSIFWQHAGVDSVGWVWDGNHWKRGGGVSTFNGRSGNVVLSGSDVSSALGYTPLANITGYLQAGTNVTVTGLGTIASPYVINSTGGGGGGSVTSFSFSNGNGITGIVTNATSTPNLSLGTSLTGIINGNGTGFSTVSIGSGLSYSGGVLSATGGTSLNGLVSANGSAFTTASIGAGLSFTGNTLTNTINNTNQLTNGAGFLTNITSLISAGTNVTITGSGTSGSPYVINSSGSGSGTVTTFSSGNLSPLFTTSVSNPNTIPALSFSLSNATANSVFGNNTGSSAAPVYYVPTIMTLNGWASGTIALLGSSQTFTGNNIFNGTTTFGAAVAFSATNTVSIGGSSDVAAHMWSRIFNSDASAVLSSTTGNAVSLEVGTTAGITLLSTGQAQLNNYTTSTSFTGTATSVLGVDASGDIIQLPSTTTIYAVEGTSPIGTHGDSIQFGGSLGAFFQPDTLFIAYQPFYFNQLLGKATLAGTDSVLIKTAAGELYGVPASAISGGGGGDAITSPNSTMTIGGTSTNTTIDVNAAAFPLSIVPATTGTINLGSSSKAFIDLYAASMIAPNTLNLGSTGSNPVNLNINGVTKLAVLSTGQLQAAPYTSTSAFTGGTVIGLLGFDASGNIYPVTANTNLSISGQNLNASGGGSTLTNNTFSMPQINTYYYTQGLASSNNVSGYTAQSIDSVPYPFTTATGAIGAESGGWVAPSTSGDSVLVAFPTGVIIGNSIVAGHTTHKGRLESSPWNPDYPDSTGQISYYLDSLTKFHWYNQGIGGQTMTQIRQRFLRDAIGLYSNPNDGRVGQTMPHKPNIIILEGGVNDVFASIPDSVIEQNFIWCSATAAQYQIPMIVLTVVGDGAGETVATMRQIMRINTWLNSGVLNQYGVTVIDIFGRWASGVYSGQNLLASNSPQYPSSLVGGDLIHFTPAGYDSVALDIFNYGKLPTLKQLVFSSPIAAANPIANLNRPNSVRISNTTSYVSNNNPFNGAFTLSVTTNAYDTVNTTGIFGDSVWVSILASTNVTGSSTQTGISSLETFLTNNPTNQAWYKSPVPFSGAQTAVLNSTSLKLTARDYANGIPVIDAYLFDQVNHGFQVFAGAGGYNMVVNGLTNTAAINSAVITAYGGIAASGAFYTTATTSQIGNFQIGSASASGTGFGICYNAPAALMSFQSGASNTISNNLYSFNPYAVLTLNTGSNNVSYATIYSSETQGNSLGSTDTLLGFKFSETINDTITNKLPGVFGGINVNNILTNVGAESVRGFTNDNGFNWLNYSGGATYIGQTSPVGVGSGKLSITDTARGLLPPRLTQSQINNLGYIKSITINSGGTAYSPAYPKGILTGGSGSGARVAVSSSSGVINGITVLDGGFGYSGSAPTFSLGNLAAGSGATFTVNVAIDSGLMVFNRTTQQMQFYNGASWVNMGGGVTTVGTFSSSSIANGASISGSTITFGPADATNPGMITTGAQTIAGLKNFTATSVLVNIVAGNSSTPSTTAGSGAGTSPTISISGTNSDGIITIITGTLPSGTNANVVKVTLAGGGAGPNGLTITLTPANSLAATLTGVTMVYAVEDNSTPTAAWDLFSGTTALTASTTYIFNYHCMGF